MLKEFVPDVWLEIFFCWLSVLLYPKIVDKRGAGGVDEEIKDVEDSVDLHEDQDSAKGLQHPIDHVKLHGYKVPILPLFSIKCHIISPKQLNWTKKLKEGQTYSQCWDQELSSLECPGIFYELYIFLCLS